MSSNDIQNLVENFWEFDFFPGYLKKGDFSTFIEKKNCRPFFGQKNPILSFFHKNLYLGSFWQFLMIYKICLKNCENLIFPGHLKKKFFFQLVAEKKKIFFQNRKIFQIFLFLFLYIKTIHACNFSWKKS